MITTEEFEASNSRAAHMRATVPHAVAARYDRKADRVVLTLSSKVELLFSPKDAQGLEEATADELKVIEITPSGFGIHFPKIDADLWLPSLLEGVLGSRKWMAARLGAQGGKSRSKSKVAAARANGALGGRPRKVAAK
jgi:hypothetical protein